MSRLAELHSQASSLRPRAESQFRGLRLSAGAGIWACADQDGLPALLISQSPGGAKAAGLQLRNFQVAFGVDAVIDEGARSSADTFAILSTPDPSPAVVSFFWAACESILGLLGPQPTAYEISVATLGVADLFARLNRQPTGSLIGLCGELLFILAADVPASWVDRWREDPTEAWDFLDSGVRLDVKATSGQIRAHEVSFLQTNPPRDTTAWLASVLVRRAAGGEGVVDLMEHVLRAGGLSPAQALKVQRVVADTLGTDIDNQMRIDVASSVDSILLFKASEVPAIRGDLPTGVTQVRFVSEFDFASGTSISGL
ncbi:hypothetical protein BH09ACT4_BH09ACT4_10720 [soil metagenome]